MKKLIQKWLGIVDYGDNIASLLGLRARIEDLESKCDDLKYDFDNLEYTQSDMECRVDEIEAIDIENLKDDLKIETDALKEEVNEVLTNFEVLTEGYTVSVKLNPPLL